MTARWSRRIRVVWEGQAEKPWIVQYDNPADGGRWTDVLRFANPLQATAYAEGIRGRDALLEAER